jgi:hypothetical protein
MMDQGREENVNSGTRAEGKNLFTAWPQIHGFAVPSQFLESDPITDDNFPYFEVIKWT